MRTSRFCFAIALMVASSVFGQVSNDSRNFPAERLRLSLDREGLIDVESPTTPGHLKWEAGVWIGVSRNPIVLYELDTGKRLGPLLQDRDSAAVWASLGLTKYLELGLEIPFSVYQWRPLSIAGATNAELPRLSAVTMGNIRVAAKVSLLQQDVAGINLALEASLGIPSGYGSDFASDPSFTFSPEVSIGRTWGRFRAAANVGIFVRPRTQFLDLTVHHELLGRLGAGYRFGGDSALDAPWEIDASLSTATRLGKPFAQQNNRSLEARLMLARTLTPFAQVFAGGGVGILSGWGTPDWRVFAGIRFYAPRDEAPVAAPKDTDGDGILDVDDKCIEVAENKNGFDDADGCPDEPDPDHDGLVGAADECPNEAGTAKNRGCPDADGDGLVDKVDRCPNSAEDVDSFEDEDGCPDPDNDGDGVLDAKDACVNVKGPLENKGCPDTDRDGDTVVDRIDNCPDVKGPAKNQGCPEAQLVVMSGNRLDILENVFFKTNSDVIETRSYKLLDNVARVIVAHPEIVRVLVEGHTDSQGAAEANLTLSNRRAASVRSYLVKHGVDDSRLVPRGFGEERPVESNDTAAGRAKNRRVVFTVQDGTEGDAQ